jgi:hypothetical protein
VGGIEVHPLTTTAASLPLLAEAKGKKVSIQVPFSIGWGVCTGDGVQQKISEGVEAAEGPIFGISFLLLKY